jgi:hypothetical protein
MTPRHAWIVDPAAGWDVVPVVAGAGAAAIGNPTTTPEAEHCAICHWMRALGSSMAGAPVKRLTVAPPRLVPGAAVAMPRTALTFDRPARAPPVSIA